MRVGRSVVSVLRGEGGGKASRQAGKVAAVEEARSFARCCCVGARSVEGGGEGGRGVARWEEDATRRRRANNKRFSQTFSSSFPANGGVSS